MLIPQLRIGELAEQLELSVETIRYYEREALMPPPRRTDANYRVYDAPLVDRLTFIRNCRSFDMTLDEIRELLALRDAPEQNCVGVNDMLDAHIQQVAERITELRRLKIQLQGLRDRCQQAQTIEKCEILSCLSDAVLPSKSSARR